MGFVLSILYLVIYYLTPAYLLGPLADLHVQVILAALVFLVSVPALFRSFLLRNPQSLALIGLAFAVALSVAFGQRWVGGGVRAFLNFIPNGLAYFLICLHFNSKKKLQILVLALLTVCLIVITLGYRDLRRGVAADNPPPGVGLGLPQEAGATASPYIIRQQNDSGQWTYRIEGLGEINDPNDFGQLIVCVIPLTFIFWRPRKLATNILFVILPICVLVFGVFLTHSRGALLAMTAIGIVSGRRRIGTIPAVLLAGVLFTTAMAFQFTGGRDISASSGEDRTDLWGESLQLMKTHPLFGVGYGSLPDYLGHTAHNTIAVCAAETGIFGLFFWSLFLFPTFRDTLWVASPSHVNEGEPIPLDTGPLPHSANTIETIDKTEINRLGGLLILSFTGFLVAGWFLSRAFVLTLFLIGGIAEAVYQMALQRGMIAPRLPLGPMALRSLGMAVSLVLVLYTMLRVLHFTQ